MLETPGVTAAVAALLLVLLLLSVRRGPGQAFLPLRAAPALAGPSCPAYSERWHRVGQQRTPARGPQGTPAGGGTSTPELEIRRATAADIPAIVAIAEQWKLGERPMSDLMDRGFLVSDFSSEDYQHLVAASDYCYVACRDGVVVGFLLAYGQRSLGEIDDTTAEWVATRLDDFVVIKQVAVDPAHAGSGVGRELYLHLIECLRGQGVQLVAAVVDTPPNVRSRAFHRKLGFTEAFSLQHPDGRTRSIWRYSTARASNEVLEAQYQAGVALYMHEDLLNWDKLRNYLYVTVATAAALGFVLAQTPSGTTYDPTAVGIVLCLVGLLTSVGFGIALNSGVAYLAMRKEAVAELEDMYINREGIRVVSRLFRTKPWLRRSPTTWVLRLAPVTGVVVWLGALVYLIVLVSS